MTKIRKKTLLLCLVFLWPVSYWGFGFSWHRRQGNVRSVIASQLTALDDSPILSGQMSTHSPEQLPATVSPSVQPNAMMSFVHESERYENPDSHVDAFLRQSRGKDVENCNISYRLTAEPGGTENETSSARNKRWVQNAVVFTDCPEITLSFRVRGQVPFILHRIWECDEIPEHHIAAINSWTHRSANGFVALWTRQMRELFISRQYGGTGLELYQRLVPGAYRADLFRYAIMYRIGGIYSDIDSTLQLALPDSFFSGVTVAVDLEPTRLLNGAILMAPPNNGLFMCAVGEVFDHAERREQFDSDLDVSGPGVLGECLRHITGKDYSKFNHNFSSELGVIGFRLLKSELAADGQHIVKLHDESILISLEPGGKEYDRRVSSMCDPGEHYSVLHRKKGVYRNTS